MPLLPVGAAPVVSVGGQAQAADESAFLSGLWTAVCEGGRLALWALLCETGEFDPVGKSVRRVGQTRRRDLNEAGIVKDLRKAGVDCTRVSGPGAPDLILRFRGSVVCVEVKTDKGKRTKAQEVSSWPIVRSAYDCMILLADVRRGV